MLLVTVPQPSPSKPAAPSMQNALLTRIARQILVIAGPAADSSPLPCTGSPASHRLLPYPHPLRKLKRQTKVLNLRRHQLSSPHLAVLPLVLSVPTMNNALEEQNVGHRMKCSSKDVATLMRLVRLMHNVLTIAVLVVFAVVSSLLRHRVSLLLQLPLQHRTLL